MLNSTDALGTSEQDYISTMSLEIIYKICKCNQLTYRDLQSLACANKALHEFISRFYFKTTYGNMFDFVKFANETLVEVKKNVDKYKETNRFSFFSPKARTDTDTIWSRIALIVLFLVAILSLVMPHILELSYDAHFEVTKLGIVLMVATLFLCAHNFYRDNFDNERLLNRSLDQKDKDILFKLLRNNPLLRIASKDIDNLLTGNAIDHRQVRLTLSGAIEENTTTLKTFIEYHHSLRGSNIKEIDLAKITESEEGQDILRKLLKDYNDQTIDAEKHVNYSCRR